MTTKDSQSDTCAECGATVTEDPHACSEAQKDASDDATERISIPAELWSTGLFKPAFSRGPAAETESSADAPAKVTAGSLLARPADLPGAPAVDEGDDEGDDEAEDAEEAEATASHADEPDVTQNTSEGESEEPTEPSDVPPPASNGIDTAFVVPAAMIAAARRETSDDPTVETGSPIDALAVTVEETPVEETPVEETPVEETPVEEIADAEDEAPSDGQATEVVPEDEDADDIVDEDVATDDVATDDVESEDAPAEDAVTQAITPEPDLDEPPFDEPPFDEPHFDEQGDDEPDAAADEAAVAAPPTAFYAARETGVLPPLATVSAPAVSTAPALSTAPAVASEADEPRERGKRGKGWIVLLVLVLLAAAAAGGWFWWQRTQDGPVRDSFEISHGAFLDASRSLAAAKSTDDYAAAGQEFAGVTELLLETGSVADGRDSGLTSSIRRAVDAELDVSRSLASLEALEAEEFGAWGAARGDLQARLERLAGAHDDIEAAGGSTADLPTDEVVGDVDTAVGKAADASAQRRTARLVKDLAGARTIKDLRGAGKRATKGASVLTAAADSLVDSDVDTAQILSRAGLQGAAGQMTRLRPETLNRWGSVRTRIERAAVPLPDGGKAVTAALATADAMVTEATAAWTGWKAQTEATRTQKQDDLAAVKAAETEVAELLSDFESLDSSLDAFLANGASLPAEGAEGEAFRTLDAAATARTALSTRVSGLGTPDEVADEVDALTSALDASAAAVRAAADAAAGCVDECRLAETPAWQALVQDRTSQAEAVTSAAEAFRDRVPGALKEIRKRKLPARPKI